MTTRKDATPVADEDLDAAQGAGGDASGILIAATVDNNVAGITPDQTTIIGGFKSMSGMNSETELGKSSPLLATALKDNK